MLWEQQHQTQHSARNSSPKTLHSCFFFFFVFGFRTRIMAPIYMDLQMWEAASLPGMTILSVAILLVLTITLLALCTRCQRWGLSGKVSRLSFMLWGLSHIRSIATTTFQDRTVKFVSSKNLSGIRRDLVIPDESQTLHTWHVMSLLLSWIFKKYII